MPDYLNELKSIAIALSIFSPLSWAVTYIFDGLKYQRSRIYLMFLMFAASFTFFMSFANFIGFHNFFTCLFPLHAGVALSLFPLFYLYVESLTREIKLSSRNFKRIYFHFIFPVSMLIFYIILQKFLMTNDEEVLFVKYILGLNTQESLLFQVGKLGYSISVIYLIISSFIYLFLSVKMWRKYIKNIHDLFPANPSKELKWVKTLFLFLFVLMIFFSLLHVINNRQLLESPILISASYLSFTLFFWFLGLQGFRQQEIYVPEILNKQSTLLKKEISKEHFEEFIQKHRPHRRTNISAFDFCIFFQIKGECFTEFIAKEYGTTFRNLMNSYRVEDAAELLKSMIQNNRKPDIDEISIKAGFDSVLTFQKVFRQYKGQTLSEFISQYSENIK